MSPVRYHLSWKLGVSAYWLETGQPDPAEELAQLVLAHRGRALPARAAKLARQIMRRAMDEIVDA